MKIDGQRRSIHRASISIGNHNDAKYERADQINTLVIESLQFHLPSLW